MISYAKKLLGLKGFFLFYWAAYACTAPYLPVFANEVIGINSREFGVIFGIVPFITTLARPLFGAAADKWGAFRSTLLFCLILQLIFVQVLYYIPTLEGGEKIPFQTACSQDRLQLLAGDFNISCNIQAKCEMACESANCTRMRKFRFAAQQESGYTAEAKYEICSNPNISSFQCFATPCEETYLRSTLPFWLFFVFLMFARIGVNSSMSLSDAIAFRIIDERHEAVEEEPEKDKTPMTVEEENRAKRILYGRQRGFGAIGYAVTSIIVGLLLDNFSERSGTQFIDYGTAFWIHTGATLLAIFSAFFLASSPNKTDNKAQAKPAFGQITQVICQSPVLLFLFSTFVIGLCSGVLFAFLAWFMARDLNSSRLCIGVAFMVQCLIETPLIFLSGRIINKIGSHRSLALSLFAFGVRFIIFSVLRDPWLILLPELLHGLCFGIFYPNMAAFANEVSPQGTKATMQGVISGVWVIGIGFGSIFGGYSMSKFGAQTTWRAFAVAALLVSTVYFCVSFFLPKERAKDLDRIRSEDNSEKVELRKAQTDVEVLNE